MKKTIQLFIILTIITIASKVLGFCREIVLSYFYGASDITDMYLMASSAATVFFGWLTTLSVLHTPLFQEAKFKGGKKRAELFSNQLILLVLCAGLFCILISHSFSKELVTLIAKGFSAEKIEITTVFFQWVVYSLIINAINLIWISEMNCKGKLVLANTTNLIFSITQMIIIFLSGFLNNVFLLKITQFMAALFQFFVLYILLRVDRRSFKINMPFMPEIKKMTVLILPVFISSLMDEINSFVDKLFASNLQTGSISALNYSNLIKQLFLLIFGNTIVTIIFPDLSKFAAKKEWSKFCECITSSLSYMILVFTPLTIFVIFFSQQIVTILYGRGAFDTLAIEMTSVSLIMYGSSLLALSIHFLLTKVFQAIQDTKFNMINGIFCTIINVFLNAILVKKYEYAGLALSTSITFYLVIPILYYILYRKRLVHHPGGIILLGCKCFIASIISAFIVKEFYLFLFSMATENLLFNLLMIATCSIIICILYIVLLLLFKTSELKAFFENLISKIKKNR